MDKEEKEGKKQWQEKDLEKKTEADMVKKMVAVVATRQATVGIHQKRKNHNNKYIK